MYEDVADEKQIAVRSNGRRRPDGGGRSRSTAAGARQPGRQRDQVHARGGNGDRQRPRATNATSRIEVADTGIGIAAHDVPRIWERLYRGDQSRAERGLGLGLSLVRAIVNAHGGTVEVSTEPGRGSTFVVSLPRVRIGAAD